VAHTGGTNTFAYDLVGNMTEMLFPNGVRQTRVYDRDSRLSSITNTDANPQSPYGTMSFVRDNNGNPTEINASSVDFQGLFPAEKITQTYDNFDRLTSTCYSLPTAACVAAGKTVWTYDKVGNRLTEKVGAAAVSTYTYDLADQLSSITGPGASTFTHNSNGDLLTVAGATSETMTYNTARQTKSSNGFSFTYDGNGNRWTVAKAGLPTSVEYWDTAGGMPTLVAEREQGNPGTIESPFFRRYTYAGSTPIRYETYETNGSPRGLRVGAYVLTDQVGSVTALTNDTLRGFQAAFRYGPFGTNRTERWFSGFSNSPRFTGQQLDGTGNYNLRARHYNPARGSFTQTDPMPYGAGSSFEGAYVYGRNNPLLMSDPTGLRATSWYNGGGQPGACAQKVEFLWGSVQGNPYSNELYDEIYVQKNGVLPADVMVAPNVGCHPNSIGCQLFMGPQGDEYQSMVVLEVPGRGMTTAVRASQLREIAGRNRVVIETPSGRMTVDLEGAAHFEKSLGRDVPTPHVKFETRHVGPNGRVTYTSGPVRDATYADLRLVERKLAGR
jgi:RHS repeat-associated protein